MKHPVADNPLRILQPSRGGVYSIADCKREAKMRRLLARTGKYKAMENPANVCMRARAEEDILAAEAILSDREQLSLACAFAIADWQTPRDELERANMALLRAEHFKQGDKRKAAYLVEALSLFDDSCLSDWIDEAILFWEPSLLEDTDTGLLAGKMRDVVATIVERSISSLGDATDDEELDLVEKIGSLNYFREILGIDGVIEGIVSSKLAPLLTLLEILKAVNSTPNKFTISPSDLDGAIVAAKEFWRFQSCLAERSIFQPFLKQEYMTNYADVVFSLMVAARLSNSPWSKIADLCAHLRTEDIQDNALTEVIPSLLEIVRLEAQGMSANAELIRAKASVCSPEHAAFLEGFHRGPRAVSASNGGAANRTKEDYSGCIILAAIFFGIALLGSCVRR